MATNLKEIFRVGHVIEKDEERIMQIVTAGDGHPWGLALVQLRQCPRHLHHKMTELFVILEGSITMEMDEQYHTLKQGDHVSIAPGRIHKVCDAAPGTRMMVFSFPPFEESDLIAAPELTAE